MSDRPKQEHNGKSTGQRRHVFTNLAALPASPNRVAIRPIIIKNGAPGGCPTSSLKEVVINSPQSQKLTVGSMVIK